MQHRTTLLSSLLCAAAAASQRVSSPGGEWQLVWSDEFEGPAVNTSTWNVYHNVAECAPPDCAGNQIELYTADNVFLDASDGVSALVLRTRPGNVTVPGFTRPFNVTSGRVDTSGKLNITFGRLEVSAKLQDDAAASGVHTAHWLLGYECWPQGGEIDIMEMQSPSNLYAPEPAYGGAAVPAKCASNGTAEGGWAKATSNYHYGPPTGQCGKEVPHPGVGTSAWPSSPTNPATNFSAAYTRFAVEWNATDLVYFVNDTQVNHVWQGMPGWGGPFAVPTWPMFLILSQAYMAHRPCGDPPAWAWPVTQRVDYVRLYQRVGEGAAAAVA